MARKPKKQRRAKAATPRGTTDRDRAIDALMALLAEQSFEQIGLAEVAGRAGLKLSALRAEFGSTLAILGAHIKDIDRAVLAGGSADMAEEPPRERLFDVLMRRLEALTPYKDAVRSLMRSARCNAGLALALNAMALRSQRWMLEAAGISAGRPARLLARARRRADVRPRARRLVRRRRGRPRPHHGRARPRSRQRRTLGRLCRRFVFAAEMHRARTVPPPPPLSRRGRSGSGVSPVIPGRERSSRTRNPGAADSALCRSRFRARRFAPSRNDGNDYTGTRTVARKPPSGLSPSVMSPPCERAMSRAMARPRPVPPWS